MSGIAMPAPDPNILVRRDAIVAGLEALVSGEGVISSETERRAFETDALTAYRRLPLAVVLPATTEETAAVMRYLYAQGVPMVPRGAGTSLAGGALPQEDAVVIGVSRMSKVLDVDLANRTARVQTGVTNLGVSAAIAHEGFFYAPDPSSQLACTIAGNVAMNSGGAHCLKYGVTTNNLMGVTFVTVEGEIVEIGGDAMDAAGLDLLGLICGSEGQFGMVTEATLRILPMAEGARPILFGFPSPEAAGACVAAVLGAGVVPVAIEYMDRLAIDICEDFARAGYPRDVGAMLIVEVEGSPAEIDEQLARIAAIAEGHGMTHMREARTPAEAAAIWKGRKSAFGAMGRVSDYICMDGTIPTGRLPEVLTRIEAICEEQGLKVANIFHAGDGNLHPLVLYDMNDPVSLAKAERAGEDILLACVEVGGCLTGEHGVGIEKRELMTAQFTRIELEQQMRVKSAFDPRWLMNPAKVFPLENRLTEAAA
ncbi:FAD-binding protein [Methylopila jiangsuensis]|uniref:FAD-binding protein n=1 Tax=Methylopila jiangsuensis TaxID=586230 RepID=A0A9W6JHY1_9HYPH|nr:FAD-linked oxidase C-terminal domain-containing protein [Methylopila jiangsuensis]MDR6286919.1 glycolate oxidase [Methylopila jiangsuensis]GLK76731.1 FAD-binding protein [Methylopila jiangsuensis]